MCDFRLFVRHDLGEDLLGDRTALEHLGKFHGPLGNNKVVGELAPNTDV